MAFRPEELQRDHVPDYETAFATPVTAERDRLRRWLRRRQHYYRLLPSDMCPMCER